MKHVIKHSSNAIKQSSTKKEKTTDSLMTNLLTSLMTNLMPLIKLVIKVVIKQSGYPTSHMVQICTSVLLSQTIIDAQQQYCIHSLDYKENDPTHA